MSGVHVDLHHLRHRHFALAATLAAATIAATIAASAFTTSLSPTALTSAVATTDVATSAATAMLTASAAAAAAASVSLVRACVARRTQLAAALTRRTLAITTAIALPQLAPRRASSAATAMLTVSRAMHAEDVCSAGRVKGGARAANCAACSESLTRS